MFRLLSGFLLAAGLFAAQDPVQWSLTLDPASAQPGSHVLRGALGEARLRLVEELQRVDTVRVVRAINQRGRVEGFVSHVRCEIPGGSPVGQCIAPIVCVTRKPPQNERYRAQLALQSARLFGISPLELRKPCKSWYTEITTGHEEINIRVYRRGIECLDRHGV